MTIITGLLSAVAIDKPEEHTVNIMNKAMRIPIQIFSLALVLCLIGIAPISRVQAQPNSDYDSFQLNGLAAFVQLREEFYIGGLYLENLVQDSGSIKASSSRKRMDIRVTIDKWTPRGFSQQWNQAILINNKQENLNAVADEILAFVDMPKADLVKGDHITIDMDPNSGTTVYLNKKRMLFTKNNTFFDVLLNCWIGPRPPSSEFKRDILSLPTDQAGTDLLVRYEATKPTKNREQLTARWAPKAKPAEKKPEKKEKPEKAVAQAALLPSDSTKATASKRTRAEVAKPSSPVTLPSAAGGAIAAPKMEVEKPKLAASKNQPKPEPKPEPKPKPKPKPAPKPAPEKVAAKEPPKQEAKKEPAQDDAQEKLLRAYTSNVLKVTYLNTQYPKRAMDFKQEGLVVLKVTINRKGDVVKIDEATSSKHQLLNRAARHAVQESQPYPEPPKDLKGDKIVVTMPFNFKL